MNDIFLPFLLQILFTAAVSFAAGLGFACGLFAFRELYVLALFFATHPLAHNLRQR